MKANCAKVLKCVATRLRVFNRDGLRDEQKRWIGHTLDIAESAQDDVERNCDRFDGYRDAVKAFKREREGVDPTLENVIYWLFSPITTETQEQRDLRNSELGAIMRRAK